MTQSAIEMHLNPENMDTKLRGLRVEVGRFDGDSWVRIAVRMPAAALNRSRKPG